ncbi:MAG: hypothetical protein CVU41_06225, partial [Chloroflexi bacterium HGW-Chloroflexi-3]
MINSQDGVIRNFQNLADLEFAASLIKQEGWHSETLLELQSFVEYDPRGCFLYEYGGDPIGICIATAYQQAGFIGQLIVAKRFRGQGNGRALMKTTIQYLQQKQLRAIFLDGVQKAIPMYEELGFQSISRSLRFFGQIPAEESSDVQPMSEKDLQEVINLDRHTFGDDRSFFLRKRWQNYPDLALVRKQDFQIAGYLFGRVGIGGWVSAGPWVDLNEKSSN